MAEVAEHQERRRAQQQQQQQEKAAVGRGPASTTGLSTGRAATGGGRDESVDLTVSDHSEDESTGALVLPPPPGSATAADRHKGKEKRKRRASHDGDGDAERPEPAPGRSSASSSSGRGGGLGARGRGSRGRGPGKGSRSGSSESVSALGRRGRGGGRGGREREEREGAAGGEGGTGAGQERGRHPLVFEPLPSLHAVVFSYAQVCTFTVVTSSSRDSPQYPPFFVLAAPNVPRSHRCFSYITNTHRRRDNASQTSAFLGLSAPGTPIVHHVYCTPHLLLCLDRRLLVSFSHLYA